MVSFAFVCIVSIGLLIWYLIYHTLAFYLKYSLKGKIILVTGTDTGFGNALTKKLDLMGSIVFATCIYETTANQLNKDTSDNVHILMMDITKIEDITKAYKIIKKYCVENKSPLFGLVNNSGIAVNSPFECTPRKTFNKVLDVNCIGLIDVTRTFLPLMRMKKYNPYIAGKYSKKFGGFVQRGKAGRIVNIASVAGRCSLPYMPSYNVSKFGVVGFTESIRYELDQFFNIWCCTVEPFFVMTNIVKSGMDLEYIKKQWLEVKKPDSIDIDDAFNYQDVKSDDDDDDVDGIMDVYDIEKYLQWKRESDQFIRKIALNDTEGVTDSIVCALSSVYPLKVYYPSWAAMIVSRVFRYILPGFVIDMEIKRRIFPIKPIKDSFLR